MQRSGAANAKRIAAGIMGLLMLAIVLFSAFYIAAEAGHTCTGEDCLICACIAQCENTLHQIGTGAVLQTAIAVSIVLMLISALLSASGFLQETPVLRKVRFNN